MVDGMTPREFIEAAGVEDWRVLGDGATAFFPTESLAASARLVQGIGELADANGHADIDVRAGGVTVRLLTIAEDYAGMTRRDLELARQISIVARDQDLSADPSAVQSLLVIVGSLAPAGVMPFWQAVLGYERRADSPEEDLVDPGARGPGFWFEPMESARPDGGGAIHVAVWVPHDRAEGRVAAALAAGGRMVRDDFASMSWTIADAAGNEADVATAMGRGEEQTAS